MPYKDKLYEWIRSDETAHIPIFSVKEMQRLHAFADWLDREKAVMPRLRRLWRTKILRQPMERMF